MGDVSSLKENMKHQDWRLRPFSAVMLRYATLDIHYLVSLYKLLVRDLLLNRIVVSSGDSKAEISSARGDRKRSQYQKKMKDSDVEVDQQTVGNGGPSVVEKDIQMDEEEEMELMVDEKVVITEDALAVHQHRGQGTDVGNDMEENEMKEEEDESGLEVWGVDTSSSSRVMSSTRVNSNHDNVLSDRFDDIDDPENDEDIIETSGGDYTVSQV